MILRDDFDPLAPQREAAFFYGLFLRGHSLETLRQDIDVPRPVAEKWLKLKDFQGGFRADLDRVLVKSSPTPPSNSMMPNKYPL